MLAASSRPYCSHVPPEWPSAARANAAPALGRRARPRRRGRSSRAPPPSARRPASARRQRDLEPRELGVVDRVVAPAQRHRALQQPHRLVVGEAAAWPARRRGRRSRPRRSTSSRPGCREVARELVEPRLEPVAVALLDRLADPPVQQRAPRRGELRLHRRAQQRVREGVAAGRRSAPPPAAPPRTAASSTSSSSSSGTPVDALEQRRTRSRGRSAPPRAGRGPRARAGGRRAAR